jgi:CheY-like chemotaxis protein
MNVKMVSRGIRPYFDMITEVNTSTRIVLWVRIQSYNLLVVFSFTNQACDGSDAIDIVRASLEPNGTPISIVFMDAIMTTVHGPEAARAMRDMGYTGCIVAVTGNTLQEDVDHYLSCGANLLLGKPLQLDKLREVLQGNVSCLYSGLVCLSLIFFSEMDVEALPRGLSSSGI